MTWYRKLWVACMPLLLFLPIVSIMASISQLLAEILPFMTLFVRLDALYAKVLPFLLAGFVSYQFCRHKDGSVVLSAMIAYLLIISVLQSEVLNEAFAYQWHVDVAVDYIQNPLTAILCGLVAAKLFERFSQVQLPKSLAFFSGRRLVPILTIFIMLGLAVPYYFIWTFTIRQLFSLTAVLYEHGIVGASISKVLNNGLVIVGLRDISDGFYILPGFQKGITVMQYGVMPAFMLAWMVFLLHKKRYPMAILVSLCLLQCLLSQASDAFVLYLFISAPLLWLVYCIGSGCIFYLAYFSVSGGLLTVVFGSIYISLLWLSYKIQWLYLPQEERGAIHDEYVIELLEVFGGMENIRVMKAMDRSLFITVYDMDFVDEQRLQKLCAYHLAKDEYCYELAAGNQAFALQQALQRLQEKELQQLLL